MVIGCRNVCFLHEFLAASPDALRDKFLGEVAHIGEDHDVEVKEPARHDEALPECFLRCFFSLLHVLDTSARAIVVVIQLMERPEVATEAKRPLHSIRFEIRVRRWLLASRRFESCDV